MSFYYSSGAIYLWKPLGIGRLLFFFCLCPPFQSFLNIKMPEGKIILIPLKKSLSFCLTSLEGLDSFLWVSRDVLSYIFWLLYQMCIYYHIYCIHTIIQLIISWKWNIWFIMQYLCIYMLLKSSKRASNKPSLSSVAASTVWKLIFKKHQNHLFSLFILW